MLGGVLVRKSYSDKYSFLIEKFFLETTGIKIKYNDLAHDERGKILPVSRWHLSVSHSEDLLAVAIFPDVEVGIDIEKSTHLAKLNNRVLQKILAPNEAKVNGSYLNNFVIKEAYSKYTGEGLSMGFSKYDANDLLKKPNLKWQDYSTDEHICYAVHGII